MREIEIIQNNDDFKSVFKSFDILNNIDVLDHPAIYHFARIIRNYIKMSEINK